MVDALDSQRREIRMLGGPYDAQNMSYAGAGAPKPVFLPVGQNWAEYAYATDQDAFVFQRHCTPPEVGCRPLSPDEVAAYLRECECD